MNRYRTDTRFKPTQHAIERLRLRFYPHLSDEKAAELLRRLAKGAKPLKVTGGRV